jgi:hypothetical protein
MLGTINDKRSYIVIATMEDIMEKKMTEEERRDLEKLMDQPIPAYAVHEYGRKYTKS